MKNYPFRKLKFRAWDKGYEKMSEPFYLGQEIFVMSFSRSGGHLLDITDDLHIMQFTGIHDTNDKEIYEGDVLEIIYTDWNYADESFTGDYGYTECYKAVVEYQAPSFTLKPFGSIYKNKCGVIETKPIYPNKKFKITSDWKAKLKNELESLEQEPIECPYLMECFDNDNRAFTSKILGNIYNYF